uniref:hypothetical protein n=1 Tax=uncultured Halomonas sp. TaxID=173971 RepID=UPI0026021E96
VAVQQFADGQVALHWFTADGQFQSWGGKADANSYRDQEAALNIDINGDGTITPAERYVEEQGELSL